VSAPVVAIIACSALAAAVVVFLAARSHHRDSQPLDRLGDLTNNSVDPRWRQSRKTMPPDDLGERRHRRHHR
jgi:hypothetical protein